MIGTPEQAIPAFAAPQGNARNSAQQPAIATSAMNAMPASDSLQNSSPAASPAPTAASRKRPVASDFDQDIYGETTPSVKRAVFGQSRSNSESERLVIEVSDGEDNDMDLDEIADSAMPQSPLQTNPLANMGPLRDFPPRPTFSKQGSSPGTPPISTPGSAAEYAKKMADIEEIKRKIAEKEAAKQNLKSSKLGKDVSSPASGFSTPITQTVPATLSLVPANGIQSVIASSGKSNVGSDATALARKQEKEKWRRRIQELEQEGLRRSNASAEPSTTSALAELPQPNAEKSSAQTEDAIEEQTAVSTPTFPDDGPPDALGDGQNGASHGPSHLPPGADSRIGSQATTVSGAGSADAALQSERIDHQMPSINAATNGNAPTAHALLAPPAEADLGMPTPTEEEDNEDGESDDVEMDESSSDSEDGEVDDDSTYDVAAHPVPNPSLNVSNQHVTDLDGTDRTDTTSVSSDESEDYEPGLTSSQDPHAFALADESEGVVASETASSSTSHPLPVGASAANAETGPGPRSHSSSPNGSAPAVDDELAPELQPPAQEQTTTVRQVREDDLDWSDIY